MTGFARVMGNARGSEFVVEVSSLNHRYFDASLFLPAGQFELENNLRNLLRNRLIRGRIRLGLNVTGTSGSTPRMSLDLDLARQYLEYHHTLKREFRLEGDVTAWQLLSAPMVAEVATAQAAAGTESPPEFQAAAEKAVDDLDRMRLREGKALAADILARLESLGDLNRKIRQSGHEMVKRQRDVVENRIKEWKLAEAVSEERLAQEVLFLVERSDITEETVRVDSHLEQTRELFQKGGEVGLKLDFLCQELHREINTIGNKSADSQISRVVVSFKAELSKIREQAQNLV